MKGKVQLIVYDDKGHEETFTKVVVLEKPCQQTEQVGLTLTEAKTFLTALQQRMVERQVSSLLATGSHYQTCGTPLRTTPSHHLPNRLGHPDTAEPTTPPLFRFPEDPSHLQSFDPPLARAHGSRAPLRGNKVGVVGVVRADGAGPQGFLARRYSTPCVDRPHQRLGHGAAVRGRVG
jgi:hypothetical protein